MHADAAAAALMSRPETIGTVVTSNMFGDMLTDEASELLGSLGLGGSASLGEGSFGLYEPVHGSAPDIAGQGKANPAGMILSMAMMLRHSLGMPEEAAAVEAAVGTTLDKGYLTADLYARYSEAPRLCHVMDYLKGHRGFEVPTARFGQQVVRELKQAA
jgi:3-isopropylmalate dehydrogenase